MKFYISQTLGDGTETLPFCPAVSNYVNDFRIIDMRKDSSSAGVVFVECNPTSKEHDLIISDPLISYIDTGGINIDDKIDLNTNVTSMLEDLELSQIPVDDLSLSSTLRQVLKRVAKRFLIRQLLGSADMPNGLDDFLTDAQQLVAKEKSMSFGVNPDLTKSVRSIIKEVSLMPHRFLITSYD